MDALNIITGIILLLSLTGNAGGSKTGFKSKITGVVERPNTYLQKIPPNASALVIVLIVLGVFQIGTLEYFDNGLILAIRIFGIVLFALFSWVQIKSYKSFGNNYSTEIIVQKQQKLKTDGIYKRIRHPQYLSQILSDLGAGLAVLSFLVIPFVLFVELPLYVLRAKKEEELLQKHLKDEYSNYKKQSGFMFPFIG
jgi:protein-S-isoprenylcysteine O-methyltransferase Ste14